MLEENDYEELKKGWQKEKEEHKKFIESIKFIHIKYLTDEEDDKIYDIEEFEQLKENEGSIFRIRTSKKRLYINSSIVSKIEIVLEEEND